MAYFKRFTVDGPEADMERNTSAHMLDESELDNVKNGAISFPALNLYSLPVVTDERGSWAILPGLCGYELESETLEDAIEEAGELEGSYGSNSDGYTIYEGEYVGQDSAPGGEVFFKATAIVHIQE